MLDWRIIVYFIYMNNVVTDWIRAKKDKKRVLKLMVLETIRERAVGWVMWLIVAAISIPFVLWGVNQYAFGGGKQSVAVVNGEDITINQYADALQNYKNQMRGALQDKYDESKFDTPETKMAVVNGLIDRELERQWMAENDMAISFDRVIGLIKGENGFQEDGKYSKELFERYLQSQGLTKQKFVGQILPSSLNKNDLVAGIAKSAFVTKNEAEILYQLNNQKRSFDYFVVSKNPFRKDAEISDEQIEEHYKNNSEKYLTDEEVKLAYVELSVDTLGDKVAVTDEEINKRYAEEKDKYKQEEQRKASHILLSVKKNATSEEEAKIKGKIEDIAARIKKGESFADLAKEFSEDPGSGKRGGDLGYFGRKAMVPEFDEVVFSLKVGELSDPVKTAFGYHLIKLDDIKEAHTKPLDDVIKKQIKRTLAAEKTRAYLTENGTEIGNIAYDDPSSLEGVAKFAGVELKETDFLAKNSRKSILIHKKVVSSVFSDDLLINGNNSDLITIGRNSAYVVRVVDYKPSAVKPLDKVKSLIKGYLVTEKAKELAQAKGKELEKSIAEGMSMADAAQQVNAKLTEAEPLPRTATKYSREVVQAAFEMPVAKEGALAVSGKQLQIGDYAVILVKDIVKAEISEENEEKVKQAAFAREGEYNQFALTNFMKSLREASEITIFEDRM